MFSYIDTAYIPGINPAPLLKSFKVSRSTFTFWASLEASQNLVQAAICQLWLVNSGRIWIKISQREVPAVVQQIRNPTAVAWVIVEVRVRSPARCSRLKDPALLQIYNRGSNFFLFWIFYQHMIFLYNMPCWVWFLRDLVLLIEEERMELVMWIIYLILPCCMFL